MIIQKRGGAAMSRRVPLCDCLHRLIDPATTGAVEKDGMGRDQAC
jgi:hypothetical protein